MNIYETYREASQVRNILNRCSNINAIVISTDIGYIIKITKKKDY